MNSRARRKASDKQRVVSSSPLLFCFVSCLVVLC